MNIDFREFLREPILLLAAVVGLIIVKSVILLMLGRLFQLSWPASIETSVAGADELQAHAFLLILSFPKI